MAKLSAKSYVFSAAPGNWDAQTAELNALVAASNQLSDDQVVGGLLKFSVADGHALYLVTSAKPLTLQHVPFGDAYTVLAPTIRGLRLADVQSMLQRERRFAALFATKKPAVQF